MSTVAVTHALKTIKLKVTPGTPTSDILDRAAAHFKLDASATALFHNGTQLSNSLPYRFLNLPAGAKLELRASKVSKPAEITIKIQFINFKFEPSSVVQKFNNQTSIKDVIEQVESELGVNILQQSKPVRFQSITKVIDQDQINDISLIQFGLENNGLIRVSLPNETTTRPLGNNLAGAGSKQPKAQAGQSDQQESSLKEPKKEPKEELARETKPSFEPEPQPKKESKPIQYQEERKEKEDTELDSTTRTDRNIVDKSFEKMEVDNEPVLTEEPEEPEEPKEIPQHVYVYKPSSSPLPETDFDESSYEVTVTHARQYQTMLAQRAHETAKDKRLRESNKKKISNIEVRVRFPDSTNLQVNFKPHETNQDLYNFVKHTLINESEEFELHIPYPPKALANNGERLTASLDSRNLLLFHASRKNGSFLKDEYLVQARDIKEAEDVQLDLNRHLLSEGASSSPKDSNIHNGVLPKRKETNISSSSQSSSGKKLPKWLRLGKK